MTHPQRSLILVVATVSLTCKASLSKTSASAHRSVDLAAEQVGAVPPRIYVSKVKNLLTGAPASQSEIDAVSKDPAAMQGLVRGWLVTPEGKAATLAFFRNSFQQAQTGITDFATVLGPNMLGNLNTPDGLLLQQELVQSFENTAWELAITRGEPFNSLWTTRKMWVTTAMLSFLLYSDSQDAGAKVTYDEAYPDELSQMYITSNPAQTPGRDNSGKWFWPVTSGAPATTTISGTAVPTASAGITVGPVNCGLSSASGLATAHVVSHPGGPAADYTDTLFQILVGFSAAVEPPDPVNCFANPQNPCPTGLAICAPTKAPWDLSYVAPNPGAVYPENGVQVPAFRMAKGQFAATDHTDWRLITTRDLAPGEKPTRFWDLAALRQVNEGTPVPLRVQRVGPFTTPAFLANWTTNANNQSRSTTNQALIISIGGSFDGTNTTALSSQADAAADTRTSLSTGEGSSDAAHASNAACQACHVALDPLRKFYSRNLNYNWAPQNDPAFTSATPVFNFGGVQTQGSSFADLGGILANHPSLAQAWVQKACYWINSSPCSDSDPELIAMTQNFQNGFQLTDMLAALLSSPMITNASASYTSEDQGEVVSISRLDHLCKTLSVRLSIPNLCNYNPTTVAITNGSIPTDGYTRGATEPFQPSQPGLFFRAALENFCDQISSAVVDAVPTATFPAGPYSSSSPGAATSDMVHNLMGVLPGDPREPGALEILNAHYTKALTSGATPTMALRSTFVLSCTSPAVVSIGL